MPQATTNDDAFSRLPAIIADSTNRNRNEAETRHKVIDFILHDLLLGLETEWQWRKTFIPVLPTTS
jgi:hypothetical protein